jgi:hypothetical protein
MQGFLHQLLSGMMAAPIVYLDPNMMSGILLYGFAAALLGPRVCDESDTQRDTTR